MKLWIARDKSGSLFVYLCKPIKLSAEFQPGGVGPAAGHLRLDTSAFPEVTWENSPCEAELNTYAK